MGSPHHRIAIAGCGFGGLGMAVRLKRDGVEDFAILEKADDLGGTWRDNSYPGCACDVPSMLYSWSFAPKPDWSRLFAPAAEIWEYQREVADRFGLPAHIRYDHEVLAAEWDGESRRWAIETRSGELTADVLISAVGALHEPAIPELQGLDSFGGRSFHSSSWDHDYELAGRSVAVIGTGASAIQFVPEIQPQVGKLHLFQRTPPWVFPRRNLPVPGSWQAMFRRLPVTQKLVRRALYSLAEVGGVAFRHPQLMTLGEQLARRHIAAEISDPDLRRRLTPDYRLGCKRILASDNYYRSLDSDNVDVVTSGLREVRPEGIVDGDGVLREVDAIIFGTGFRVTDPPISHRVRGRDGRTLAEHWQGSPQAYLGTAVAGFPNLFILLGPGTGLGHNSIIYMLESQARYVSEALRFLRKRGATTVEPRSAAQRAWVDEVDRHMQGTVWVAGGCNSWYLDETGRNSTLWPKPTWQFRRRLERFVESENLIGAPLRAPALVPA
jgi:cation diffusion facilitator CzcD-associated flavoprotein CzcO